MNYYIGLSLSATSGMDSGVAVMNENGELILVDKLFTMNDVIYFFDNYPNLKYSKICISMVWDRTLLNGKWRILSKPYQMVSTNPLIPNRESWTKRYSARGCEYFKSLQDKGIEINRFELYLTRQSLNLNSCYRERTPADCKFLQQTLNFEWGFNLPSNMMPMAQLEGIIGAILAKENYELPQNIKKIAEYKNFDVIDVIQKPVLISACD